MKYKVGDLVFIIHCKYKPRLHPHLRPRLLPRLLPRPRPELYNSYGIVTQAVKHSDAWEGQSTNGDNVYIWYSQVEQKEYYFYEDEVIGEVVE